MKIHTVTNSLGILFLIIVLALTSNEVKAQFPDSTAIFIVADDLTLTAAEQNIVSRLEGMGFVIIPVGQNNLNGDALIDGSLVLISATVTSGTVVTNLPGLKDLSVPVICWEPGLYDDMGFQAGTTGEFNTSVINIIDAAHPLAGGMTAGEVTIANSEKGVSYGIPEGDAIIVAVNINDETQAVLFGYEKGAAMSLENAPARRVGTFLLNDVAADMTEDGWTIFDSTVVWAMGPKTTTAVEPVKNGNPSFFALYDNYPNPFNPGTNIQFQIPQDTHVNISIYNTLGQHIATLVNEHLRTGVHQVAFNAAGLPSGTYFYNIKTDEFSQVKKMILLK